MQSIEVEFLKLEILLLCIKGIVDDVVIREVFIDPLLVNEVVALKELHLLSHTCGACRLEIDV